MPFELSTLDDAAEFLPDAPEFGDASNAGGDDDLLHGSDGSWVSAKHAALLLGLTDQGLLQVRRRFRNRYEHKIKNRVYIHFPLFMRLYKVDLSNRSRRSYRGY